MIKWYHDKELGIFFDNNPCVAERYILPSMTDFEKKSIQKYPFINKKNLKVTIEYYKKDKTYEFIIPKGFCYDGASIVRIFWRLIGSNTDNSFTIPALIHDYCCIHKEVVDNDRYLADKVFERCLYVSNVPSWKRFLMFRSVELFQICCAKW